MAAEAQRLSLVMRLALPLALIALASSVRADGLRMSLTGGTGIGRDAPPSRRGAYFLGGQLEAGFGHWTVFAGELVVVPYQRPDHSLALGARWSMQPDGSGFGVALQSAIWTSHGSPSVDYRESTTVVAATAHWRWLFWKHLVLDVGAGPALSFDSYRFPTRDYDANNGKLLRRTCVGIVGDPGECVYPLDVELGLGLAF